LSMSTSSIVSGFCGPWKIAAFMFGSFRRGDHGLASGAIP
jgi:hypothetical protein